MTKAVDSTHPAPMFTWRRPPPAVLWALLGAVALVFQAWVWGGWLLDGGFNPSWQRPGTMPTFNAVAVRLFEAVIVLSFLFYVWIAVREARAQRRIGFHGAVLIGYFLAMWQDPMCDPSVSFSVYALHTSTWGTHIPFFSGTTPDGLMSLIAPGGICYPTLLSFAVVVDGITRALTRHRPGWGTLPRYLVATAVGTVVITLIELICIGAGMYSYSSYSHFAQTLAVGGGHWYQVSLPESFAAGALIMAPVAVMRHTWRNGGTPVIFRGIDTMSSARASVMSVLAAAGLINAMNLIWMLTAGVFLYDSGTVVSDLPAYFR